MVSDHDLEQTLEKKLNDLNIFVNSIFTLKKMITCFKDENHKSRKKYKKLKMLSTILKSFDTIVIIATTSCSSTLSVTGFGLIAIPISASTPCGLEIGNKVIYEIFMQKYSKYQEHY